MLSSTFGLSSSGGTSSSFFSLISYIGRRMDAFLVAEVGDVPGRDSGVLSSAINFCVSFVISSTFWNPGIIVPFGVGDSSEAPSDSYNRSKSSSRVLLRWLNISSLVIYPVPAVSISAKMSASSFSEVFSDFDVMPSFSLAYLRT